MCSALDLPIATFAALHGVHYSLPSNAPPYTASLVTRMTAGATLHTTAHGISRAEVNSRLGSTDELCLIIRSKRGNCGNQSLLSHFRQLPLYQATDRHRHSSVVSCCRYIGPLVQVNHPLGRKGSGCLVRRKAVGWSGPKRVDLVISIWRQEEKGENSGVRVSPRVGSSVVPYRLYGCLWGVEDGAIYCYCFSTFLSIVVVLYSALIVVYTV
jgi:hypothetical protein